MKTGMATTNVGHGKQSLVHCDQQVNPSIAHFVLTTTCPQYSMVLYMLLPVPALNRITEKHAQVGQQCFSYRKFFASQVVDVDAS